MKRTIFSAVLAGAMAMGAVSVAAQTSGAAATKPASLGTVKISRDVTADGKPLAAGTYSIRVTDEKPAPVVGQTPDESRWVEFVQGGTVKGREVATVLSKAALDEMKKRSEAPAAGASKVELLKGEDYLRVWINRGGTNYLVHLSVAK